MPQPPAATNTSWSELESAAPRVAESGKALLDRSNGAALLATVRGDSAPRLHPVTVAIRDGGLYVFLLDSAKRRDLVEDGRYALHAHQDPANPAEFSIRGRARRIPDGRVRDAVANGWYFGVDDTYWLFELRIETAILGERTAEEWPPRYTRWSAGGS
jgi:Pyridoxamine 5'-phosphate oxidase